jgi:hypothetical protein
VVAGVGNPADLAVVPVHALALAGELVGTAGSWALETGAARFTPVFPPVPATVHAVVARSGPGWTELCRVSVPAIEMEPSTRVDSIDPGGDHLPANVLRMSVTFSAPMQEGGASGRFHLLAEDGGELIGTLLPMPPELWDRPRRRLTVLLEPGRIKRGLQPNVQAGPPLVPGTSVTFVVDGQLTDAAGAPLVSGAERTYRIDKPIRSRVDPAGWEVRWPDSAGGQLVVRFGRSLDRALVRRCLRVVGPDGRVVPGQAILDRDAAIWTFTPAIASVASWSLHVHPDLEDVAGNSVRRPFDRDLWDREAGRGSSLPVVLTTDWQRRGKFTD